MKYKITVLDKQGKTLEYIDEADNINTLRAKILQSGYYLVEYSQLEYSNEIKTSLKKTNISKIKLKHWSLFAYQMQLLLKSKLTIDATLIEIRKISISEELNKFIDELYNEIMAGSRVSEFFEKKNLDESLNFISGLLKAGELSGDLTTAFFKIYKIIDERLALRNKILAITIYPAILLILSIVFFIFLVSHILPNIANIFYELNAELPMITKLVLRFAEFMRKYGLLLFFVFLILFWVFCKIRKLAKVKIFLEKLKFHCPIVNKFYLNYILIKFTGLLAALLENNVQLLNALALALKSSGSVILLNNSAEIIKKIESGATLSETLSKYPQFPAPLIRLTRTGEKTNSLPQIFNNLQQMYNEELNTQLKILTSIIEPLIMILIGAVISILILAVIVPVLKLRT